MTEQSFSERVVLKALRTISPTWRARTDLFLEPYRSWVPWQSGLGDGGRILHSIVRMYKPTTIVEIGSARGYSTCSLALACAENGNGMVYAIDPHLQNDWTDVGTGGKTLGFLQERMRLYDLEAHCSVIAKGSAEAAADWNRTIDLLFIDGDHTLAGVRRDFEGFERWLSPESLVVFHDSSWEHDQPWSTYSGEEWYREDMGVPAYLDQLQTSGYKGVTFMPNPGLTIMHPRRGGFEFLRRAPSDSPRRP